MFIEPKGRMAEAVQSDSWFVPLEDYQMDPLLILNDNLGTVQTINNPESTSGRSKHIDTRYFRVRQHVKAKQLRFCWIETNFNIADFFTKGLRNPKFKFFCDVIGMRDG